MSESSGSQQPGESPPKNKITGAQIGTIVGAAGALIGFGIGALIDYLRNKS